jgi:hypothetical protein
LKVGLAAFLDWARVYGRDAGSGSLWSPGAGLRFGLFGRTLRLDTATALDRGGIVLSAGWVESF